MENRSNTAAAGSRQVLSKEQFDHVFSCLSDLSAKLRISAVFLTDGPGRVVAMKKSAGFTGDITVLSTLAAASYSATNEMAHVLGESEPFRMVLHEGKTRNMFVCSVCGDYFLVVVFDSGTALGMIRLFTKRTAEQIEPMLLRSASESFDMSQVFGGRFESLLGEELDRSFTERI